MTIEFDVTLSAKDMFRFHMYQVYTTANGLLSILFAVVAFVLAVLAIGRAEFSYALLYGIFGVAFLLYLPVTLYFRSKKTLEKSEMLRRPLHYSIDDEGITISRTDAEQKKESALLAWDQVHKMVASANNVIIYSKRSGACVIPRAQLADKYQALAELAAKKLPAKSLKMRGTK